MRSGGLNYRTEFVVALHNQPQGGLAMRRAPTEVRVARGNAGGYYGFTRWLGGSRSNARCPEEGEPVDPKSIVSLPLANQRCVMPQFNRSPDDPFLRQVDASDKKWVIVTDPADEPPRRIFISRTMIGRCRYVVGSLESSLNSASRRKWWESSTNTDVIGRMKVTPERSGDNVIESGFGLGGSETNHHGRRPSRASVAGHRHRGSEAIGLRAHCKREADDTVSIKTLDIAG
jgi:hypothetical protein